MKRTDKKIIKAMTFIKEQHNGEMPYQFGTFECAKMMAKYLKKQFTIHGFIDSATLIKQQLELIDQKILVQIVYESGFWCYILHRLPSDEDIKFSESGECQDGDLWKRAEQLNNDWWEQEQESFLEALTNGIKDAKHYLY